MAKNHHRRPDATTRMVYVVAFLQPFVTIPQVYTIWAKHEKGASLLTWGAYLACSVIWFLYALKIKDKPLIITYILWLVFESLVVVGLATH